MSSRLISRAFALATIPSAAFAGTPSALTLELTDFTAQLSSPPLSQTYTGRLAFTRDGVNDQLASILIDGVPQAISGFLVSLDGQIQYTAGDVVSGYLHLTVTTLGTNEFSAYTAVIDPDVGGIRDIGGGAYTVSLGFTHAALSRETYAGVPVGDWHDAGPLGGTVRIDAFRPNTGGLDPNVNATVIIFEPGDPADLNHDGVVDSSDLAIILAAWSPLP